MAYVRLTRSEVRGLLVASDCMYPPGGARDGLMVVSSETRDGKRMFLFEAESDAWPTSRHQPVGWTLDVDLVLDVYEDGGGFRGRYP